MPLELPAPAVPCVAQLLYQPIHGRVASSAAKLSAMRDQVCTSAMDGSALALAVALRYLAALGVSATDEVGGERSLSSTLKLSICQVNSSIFTSFFGHRETMVEFLQFIISAF